MISPSDSLPFTVGVRTLGAGTFKDQCSCTAWPLRLRYEVRQPKAKSLIDPDGPGDPIIRFLYGDRWIANGRVSRDMLESGRLAEAFSRPVTVAFQGYCVPGPVGEHLGGYFYAITDWEENPRLIQLGSHLRTKEELRFPGEPTREIADVLLERLFGAPSEEVERLLASVEPGALLDAESDD
jgi:hypothetical protein